MAATTRKSNKRSAPLNEMLPSSSSSASASPRTAKKRKAALKQRHSMNATNSNSNSSKAQSKSNSTTANDSTRPSRPLSAYNIFFQVARRVILAHLEDESHQITHITQDQVDEVVREHRASKLVKRLHRKTHGRISFHQLNARIAAQWRHFRVHGHGMELLHQQAHVEKQEYLQRVAEWQEQQQGATEGDEEEPAVVSDAASGGASVSASSTSSLGEPQPEDSLMVQELPTTEDELLLATSVLTNTTATTTVEDPLLVLSSMEQEHTAYPHPGGAPVKNVTTSCAATSTPIASSMIPLVTPPTSQTTTIHSASLIDPLQFMDCTLAKGPLEEDPLSSMTPQEMIDQYQEDSNAKQDPVVGSTTSATAV